MSELAAEHEAPELSIVLPAHNEVTLLGSTVTNLTTGLDERSRSYEIVIVENGSHDGTLRLARLLAAQLPRLRVLTLPAGDYGAALAAGFLAAEGAIVVNFDVDYYDLAFLDKALELLSNASCSLVVASKRAPGAMDRRPWHRRLVTYVFTSVLDKVFGMSLSDAHGMKALRRDDLLTIVQDCVMTRALFDVELVLRADRAGLRGAEVPAFVVERRPPRSTITRRSLETIGGLARLALVLRHVPSTPPAGAEDRRRHAPEVVQARLSRLSNWRRS
ncbi:MAG TPA: glycosyltransferase family 2 protein [Acidimicrobiales bacterium]|nr:glycosyltransferase family 2 protein [Acidimicrobiales bacterium]